MKLSTNFLSIALKWSLGQWFGIFDIISAVQLSGINNNVFYTRIRMAGSIWRTADIVYHFCNALQINMRYASIYYVIVLLVLVWMQLYAQLIVLFAVFSISNAIDRNAESLPWVIRATSSRGVILLHSTFELIACFYPKRANCDQHRPSYLNRSLKRVIWNFLPNFDILLYISSLLAIFLMRWVAIKRASTAAADVKSNYGTQKYLIYTVNQFIIQR